MFFSISTDKFDDRFFNHTQISKYFISLDAGWNQTVVNSKQVIYKGYCDSKDMLEVAADFSVNAEPKYYGNFAVIVIDDDSLTLSHDLTRSFPLTIDTDGFLTNITKKNSAKSIWADRYVIYHNTEIEFKIFDPYCDIDGDFENRLSMSQCIKKINDIIVEKLNFVNTVSLPKKIFLTAGIDTTLLYAIANKNFKDVELVTYEHVDYNNFLLLNYHPIKNEYAVYNQMQCWKSPTLLFSGAPGDEYFMRGPYVSGLWAAWHNIDLLQRLQHSNHYHQKHFFKESCRLSITESFQQKSAISQQYTNYTDLCWQILNICANDHQMWHLNNTLTWTPYKDLRILATVLRLETEDLLEQITNATLSKQLIANYDATALDIISCYKNHKSFENFLKIPKFKNLFE